MKENLDKSVCKNGLRIKAVGDICPGDQPILGAGICSLMKKYGSSFPLKGVEGLFNDADIVLGNLEGLLSSRMESDTAPVIKFCGLPKFANELRRHGFNLINIANNHIFERGPELFLETLNILQDAGIKVCGRRDTQDYYSKPVFIKQNCKTVGIIGYNWVGKDKFPYIDKYIAQSHDSIVNYTWDRKGSDYKDLQRIVHKRNKNVISDIEKLKKEVDFAILLAHWGYEYVHVPPYGVALEAKSFIDAGADLIIGAHPHVLQGMEQYRHKWIFYSLGNFLFDMRFDQSKMSAVLDYEIREGEKDKFKITYLQLNDHFQPMIANRKEQKKIETIIEDSVMKISSGKKVVLLNDDKLYREYERNYNKRKFINVMQHFKMIRTNPASINHIFRKALNFLRLIRLRMLGEKIRW